MIRFLQSLLTVLLLAPVPVWAVDVSGEITAQIDGAEKTWFLTRDGDQSQSGWQQVVPGLTDVSLWGHSSPDTATSAKGALLLDFNAMKVGGTIQAVDPTLQFLENGYSSGWLATDAETISITIDSFEVASDTLTLSGSFQATASYSDNIMAQSVDASRTTSIAGTFRATLPGQ